MAESFYVRVLPRDLFNEAKLLKCLGFLALHIHDDALPALRLEFDDEAFCIDLSESGELYCANVKFWIGSDSISFYTPYNDKSPFPLQFCFDDEIGAVFNDDGSYTDEFKSILGGTNSE